MNFFQRQQLLLIAFTALLATNGSVFCDILDDIQLKHTGDEFWDWMFGPDPNQPEYCLLFIIEWICFDLIASAVNTKTWITFGKSWTTTTDALVWVNLCPI